MTLNQSVTKALGLLEFLAERKELSLGDIARMAAIPKPTAYRLLTALEDMKFVRKIRYSDLDIRYQLGLKLLELGTMVAEDMELRKVALSYMKALCTEVEEVIHLVIRDGTEAVYIEKVESRQPIRLHTRVGKRSPLYVGSGPKLLLAFMPDEERHAYIETQSLDEINPRTISNRDELSEEVRRIRQEGFATSDGEQDEDTIGISFPVRDHRGEVVAALGVSGLKYRFSGSRFLTMKEKTGHMAELISKELGFVPLKNLSVRDTDDGRGGG
jgi:IclR family transcriptional regulator, KDG regulon repressor